MITLEQETAILDLLDEIAEDAYDQGRSVGLAEGARQALDAAALVAETNNDDVCSCGCGLTNAELDAMDAAFEAARAEAEGCGCDDCQCLAEAGSWFNEETGVSVSFEEIPSDDYVLLTKGDYDEILGRLEALEYEAGVKFVG
jgi:hypothetical protein